MSEQAKTLVSRVIDAFRYYGRPDISILACHKMMEEALAAAHRAGRIEQARRDAGALSRMAYGIALSVRDASTAASQGRLIAAINTLNKASTDLRAAADKLERGEGE